MSPAEKRARLRLIRSEQIGPSSFLRLIGRFGTAEAAVEALPALASAAGGRAFRLADADAVAREMEAVERLGGRYLFLGEQDYPPLLSEAPGAPPVLVVKGRLELAARPAIAMVGARNASAAACRFARRLAADLGAAGFVIVSGLARGVDSAAHDGALATGTVAAVAGGLDIVYPPENAARQQAVGEEGLIVSEQPPGTEPKARHFPWRNRIIAGLAAATVVVEAAPRSGSLITARNAADFGREVMAVPGSPLDPRAQGCNQLIRDGAILVQSAADIIESLAPIAPEAPPAPRLPFDAAPAAAEGEVESLLGPTPVPVDEIVRQSGLDPAALQTALLELELVGRLERHAGGKVSLRV